MLYLRIFLTFLDLHNNHNILCILNYVNTISCVFLLTLQVVNAILLICGVYSIFYKNLNESGLHLLNESLGGIGSVSGYQKRRRSNRFYVNENI